MSVARVSGEVAATASSTAVGCSARCATSGLAQRVEAEGVGVGAVEQDDSGQLLGSDQVAQLGQLVSVLGDEDPRIGMRDDVGELFPLGVGVDRRRRPAGAVDRQVEQHPLDAGAGRDRDALFRAEPQGEQARGDLPDDLAGPRPRQADPGALVVGVPEGLRVR
jgi:hypothetical protein